MLPIIDTLFSDNPNPPSGLHAGSTILLLIMCVSGIMAICSAILIVHRKGRVFSLIVSGIGCLFVPLGTIVGIYTYIVMRRPQVMEQYMERKIRDITDI
jgi:hypothetical protein